MAFNRSHASQSFQDLLCGHQGIGSRTFHEPLRPVILHPRDYDRWLNDYDDSRPPIDLLRPYEADGLRMTPANRAVGNVHNNGPEMLNSA
jgi:putative SOS response-associated peptidase YedK